MLFCWQASKWKLFTLTLRKKSFAKRLSIKFKDEKWAEASLACPFNDTHRVNDNANKRIGPEASDMYNKNDRKQKKISRHSSDNSASCSSVVIVKARNEETNDGREKKTFATMKMMIRLAKINTTITNNEEKLVVRCNISHVQSRDIINTILQTRYLYF